eukprot:2030352-Pleurochrysis_carterae.AAC.1
MAGDAAGGRAEGGAPGREPSTPPSTDGVPPGVGQVPGPTPSTAPAMAAQGSWRVDIASFVAAGAGASGTRGTSAGDVAHRAAALGLAGPLGVELADRWRDGDPSSPAARTMRALRTAARARVMEVTDARRTGTALSWFSDFAESTEREPFVDPADPGGATYNLETLVLFA